MSSALPRPLVPRYPSNRLAALALAAALYGGVRIGAGGAGYANAVRTFFTWSLARELDPDHHGTSEVVVLASLAQHLWELERFGDQAQPQTRELWYDVLGDMAQLSSLRMLVASVGTAPTRADTAQLALAGIISGYLGRPVLALLPALSLQLSAQLRDVHSPHRKGEPALSAALAVGAWLVGRQRQKQPHVVGEALQVQQLSTALCLSALALGGVVTRPEAVRSHCDELPVRMSAQRVRLTRQVALGVVSGLLLSGQSRQGAPLALAFALTGLRRLFFGRR